MRMLHRNDADLHEGRIGSRTDLPACRYEANGRLKLPRKLSSCWPAAQGLELRRLAFAGHGSRYNVS